jgi:hypothetical protein
MWKQAVLALSVVLLSLGTAALAEGDDEKSKWHDRLTISGDFGLRYEGFDWEDKFDDDERNRFRYRLRFGVGAKLTEQLAVGLQLRSGNPNNPQSDNQTLDGGFSKNEISIAEAFVDYRPGKFVGLKGGKFSPKKLWMVSDMQWDNDVVVEGLMETFSVEGAGALQSFEASLYQFVLEESSSSGDAYLFGVQVRPVLKLNEKNHLTLGAGYDSISRPDKIAGLTLSGDLDTEPSGIVTNIIDPNSGELVSDFRILSAFAEWKYEVTGRWPIKVSVFYYQNLGAQDAVGDIIDDTGGPPVVGSLNGDENDTGHYARIQVGDYKELRQVAVRLTRYNSEPDAIFYAWVQSNTMRGSNVDGERLDVRIGMPLKSHINLTYYRTDWNVGTDTTMNRWHVDYIFKF